MYLSRTDADRKSTCHSLKIFFHILHGKNFKIFLTFLNRVKRRLDSFFHCLIMQTLRFFVVFKSFHLIGDFLKIELLFLSIFFIILHIKSRILTFVWDFFLDFHDFLRCKITFFERTFRLLYLQIVKKLSIFKDFKIFFVFFWRTKLYVLEFLFSTLLRIN